MRRRMFNAVTGRGTTGGRGGRAGRPGPRIEDLRSKSAIKRKRDDEELAMKATKLAENSMANDTAIKKPNDKIGDVKKKNSNNKERTNSNIKLAERGKKSTKNDKKKSANSNKNDGKESTNHDKNESIEVTTNDKKESSIATETKIQKKNREDTGTNRKEIVIDGN